MSIIENKNNLDYCKFFPHPLYNEKFLFKHFCQTCKVRLCEECLKRHDKIYSTHNLKEIKTDKEKLKTSLEVIESDESISNISQKDEENIGNSLLINFTRMLATLNNNYIKLKKEYDEKNNEIEDKKKDMLIKVKNKDINITEEINKINNDYNELFEKQEKINSLVNSIKDLINSQNNQQNQIQISKAIDFIYNNNSIISNSNNIRINIIEKKSPKNEKHNNNANEGTIKEKGKEIFKINNDFINSNNLNIHKPSQNLTNKTNEQKIISNKAPIKKLFNTKKNYKEVYKCPPYKFNINFNYQKQYNNHSQNVSNWIQNEINLNRSLKKINAMNKEKENKESKFSFEGDKNEKIKIDNTNYLESKSDIDDNSNNEYNFQNKNINNSDIINNNNINNDISGINSKFIMFNIGLNKEAETFISVIEKESNKINNKIFYSSDIRHKLPFLYNIKFPFLCCRLININNKAFIIGGKSYLDANSNGNNFVFKINYINNTNTDKGIYCEPMKDTIYPHQSHNLIYSELYNSIFVLSGKGQRRCEYGIIDKEKEFVEEWKEITPLLNSRENVLCFLFNEKYIFLFGEKKGWENYNYYKYNYDVFDISSIFNNKSQKWKNYSFNVNKDNEAIFNVKLPGIIEENNYIFILGGCEYNLGNNLNWKISFEDDKDSDNIYKKIETIDILNSSALNECKGYLSFYGQQKFFKYQDIFFNINIQGKCLNFQIYQLDDNMWL